MGKRIGCAREKDVFYYLEESSGQFEKENSLSLSLLFESSMPYKEKIWLYHHRLGHPSFSALKVMFPISFKEISVEHFHCAVCELAKHKHASLK